MKLYSVQVTAICNVAIFADNAEEALEGACGNISYGDLEMVNGGPAELIEDDDDDGARECYIRHADVVLDGDWRHIRASKALELIGAEA